MGMVTIYWSPFDLCLLFFFLVFKRSVTITKSLKRQLHFYNDILLTALVTIFIISEKIIQIKYILLIFEASLDMSADILFNSPIC